MSPPNRLRRRSRREFLALAGSGLASLLAPGAAKQAWASSPDTGVVSRYYSRPDLSPPKIAVATAAPTIANGYVFLAPIHGQGQQGPLIVDNAGEPVWFHPSQGLIAHNFRVQKLAGKPVLTWWEGQDVVGYPQGNCVIADTSYRVLKRLSGTFTTEEHEFLITSRNTALISAVNFVPSDLSTYGASAAGTLVEGAFQEIDIATGKILLEWHSADHVSPDESYYPAADAWDYFHLNSIDVAEDGDLLLSARHTSTVYKLDRRSGEIIWRLGGKKSDFEVAPGAQFAFQHDARSQPGKILSLFDNAARSPETATEPASRAIVVALDTTAMTARLVGAIPNPHGSLTRAMGNSQLLTSGGRFIGWGTAAEFSEFSPSHSLLFDAQFADRSVSYRAFRHPWIGKPTRPPDFAFSGNTDGTLDLFASWNGATEVSHWQFVGGSKARALRVLRTVPRQGFETRVRLPAPLDFVAAVALDASGRKLGSSKTLRT